MEYAGSARGVLYLYGYLFKGQKKVSLFLESAPLDQAQALARAEADKNEDDEDEILNFVRGQFLCAMDGCWRFFGFQTYPSPYPKVLHIKLSSKESSGYHLGTSGSLTQIAIYFLRPEVLHGLKYTELYAKYIVYAQLPKGQIGREGVIDGYFTLKTKGQKKKVYLCKRKVDLKIVQMKRLYITAGKSWVFHFGKYDLCFDLISVSLHVVCRRYFLFPVDPVRVSKGIMGRRQIFQRNAVSFLSTGCNSRGISHRSDCCVGVFQYLQRGIHRTSAKRALRLYDHTRISNYSHI